MTSVNELSKDVLLKIFRHLELNDLISVCRVNKKFKLVAENPQLYQELRITRAHRLDDVVNILRKQSEAINVIKMQDISDSNTVLQYVALCANLRKLAMKECDGERGIKEISFDNLFARTNIKDLALKNCELEKFPKLNLKNVRSLLVVDNTSYQHPLEYMKEILPFVRTNNLTLSSLKLCVDNVTSVEQDDLFSAVENCPNLEVFQYQYPHVDEVKEHNFKKLFTLRNLVALSIVISNDTSQDTYDEFLNRPSTGNLRKIEFGGNICSLLPNIVRQCPDLEILRLVSLGSPFLKISNEDLLNMLSRCKKLREIDMKTLSVNNIRHAILQLPTYLPNLEHAEIEVDAVDESSDNSIIPLKIEFNLLPRFVLETQTLEESTSYVLFRSEELMQFLQY